MIKNNNLSFPLIRPRRLRQSAWIRDLIQEYKLTVNDLIYPMFVQEGDSQKTAIKSLPNIYRYSIDLLVKEVEEIAKLGIKAIALFPVTPQELKNNEGSEALNPDNLICRAVKEIKNKIPNIGIICDVALDPYTSHGHDGILIDGKIANDQTVDMLVKQSLNLVKAGCNVVAPSDMMDGRIISIRNALEQHDYTDTIILSYTAKYASKFYGPFRDAVGSATNLAGDSKNTYQMNYANSKEAILEAVLDISEGTDILMVKPGMPYLDILNNIVNMSPLPVFVYQVSGEYAMIYNSIANNIIDQEAIIESLTAFKRAGANAILTYAAKDVANIL